MVIFRQLVGLEGKAVLSPTDDGMFLPSDSNSQIEDRNTAKSQVLHHQDLMIQSQLEREEGISFPTEHTSNLILGRACSDPGSWDLAASEFSASSSLGPLRMDEREEQMRETWLGDEQRYTLSPEPIVEAYRNSSLDADCPSNCLWCPTNSIPLADSKHFPDTEHLTEKSMGSDKTTALQPTGPQVSKNSKQAWLEAMKYRSHRASGGKCSTDGESRFKTIDLK
ncbi:hypothetical protein GYMLUDRAFT_61990 [Collybiopsis luxurians FD-317 M1]|uniref:Uncharacterized protein n=1 Tax=Collybiopsis luxurians FD-317 M1 TaxID=944289 RepID=A0A0D0BMZ8_9AGAR|nr:hypothetical protein GYMLUDRAFT_61990 [Collybiopsis luxurians FD-317 M1]